MIGQTNLKSKITDLIESNHYPRFTILVGQEGSGRKVISNFIADKLGAQCAIVGISVDEVRTVISEAYKVSIPMLYVLADADKMSPAAKNALLKVTEEPPQSAYFILTITDLNSTLGTIRSRGMVMYMDPYSIEDIDMYYREFFSKHEEEERSIIANLCETPGEVNTIVKMGTVAFYQYAQKVVDNIAEVSGSNSFKIANNIKFKDTDEDKYDLRLFWKAFMTICADRLHEDRLRYATGIQITSKYVQELRITGINRQSTFDCWILDLRKEWM